MDLIFHEFEQDLGRVVCQLELIDKIKDFAKQDNQSIEAKQENNFFVEALNVHKMSRDAHTSLPILTGTLVLYLAGRFEEFTKTLFEDLCQRLVQRADTFDHLPKKMQENLVVYTALVMQDPRRYGHAENGVRAFVATLSENIKGGSLLTRVNHECLSITEYNMREKILSDLFERVGVSAIWKDISQQASVLAHFETRNPGEAERKTL